MAEQTDPVARAAALRVRVREALLGGEDPSVLGPIGDLRLAALASDEPADAVLARHLDDLPRRVAFQWLAEVRGQPALEADAVARVARWLGPGSDWAPQLKRSLSQDAAHLVLVLTWQCETRCTYCAIPKQAGRVMSPETVDAGVDLLLSADAQRLELRFFGGEPLLEWDLIQRAITRATERADGRDLGFVITSNGWALTPERLRWLSDRPVRLQLALEGRREAQNRFRPSLEPGLDSYDHSPAPHAPLLRELGLAHDVIWVVGPASAGDMVDNFQHLMDLGFPRIQLNWAHNQLWGPARREAFADGLHHVAGLLRARWDEGRGPWLVNLQETLARVRTFREPTVDHDGAVFANNAFLYRPQEREALQLGHLDDRACLDRYRLDGLSDEELLARSFPESVSRNNAGVGAVLNSFVRWMASEGLPDPETLGP